MLSFNALIYRRGSERWAEIDVKNERKKRLRMGSREVDGSGERTLAVNTDGIIICVSIVHEKASQRWGGDGGKKESGSRASGRTTSGGVSHSVFVTFSGFLFVSGGITQAVGELSDGNRDINLP